MLDRLLKYTLLIIIFGLYFFSYSSANEDSWKKLESNNSDLLLSFTPILTGIDTILCKDGRKTIIPSFKDCYQDFINEGKPIVLASSKSITVPSPNNFKISKIEIKEAYSIYGTIAPRPKIILKDGSTQEIYDINEEYYKLNEQNWANIEYSGISRNRHIALLKIHPYLYNPNTNIIQIPKEIIVHITFDSFINNAIINEDNSFSFSINHSETKNWIIDIPSSIKIDKKKDELLNNPIIGWLKVKIESEGIYKIDANMLSTAGANINKELISTIKLFGNGGIELSEIVSDAEKNILNEQPIIVKTKNDGTLDYILFYGASTSNFTYKQGSYLHYINHYSNNNYYILAWGGSEGKRAEALENPTGTPQQPNTYTNYIFYEEEVNNPFLSAGSGRTWFGGTVFPRNFVNHLFNLDPSGQIKYRFSLAHRAKQTGKFIIYEGGNQIATLSIPSSNSSYVDALCMQVEASAPASILASIGYSNLKIEYSNPEISTATPFFDWLEISYPRSFAAVNNEINIYTEPNWKGLYELNVNNFTGEVIGFNTTDPANPKLLLNKATTNGLFIFTVELEQDKPQKYFISGNLKIPELQQIEISYLRHDTCKANVIVITHPDLIKSAEDFANYRAKQSNLITKVVRTDAIYNEFGSGIADPTAIRDFISYALRNWSVKPTYVVLWGDGHFDYKNIQTKEINFVPPYESLDTTSFSGLESYTTDDYFARAIGNDNLVDVALGRMPVSSEDIGQMLLNKIKHYENNSSDDGWRVKVTLLADDGPKGRPDWTDWATHTNQSERLSYYYIPNDIQQKKIYLAEYLPENLPGGAKKPRAMEDLVTDINTSGALLLNWIGHGNPSVWAHEKVYEKSITNPMFNNIDKLFFATAATCEFGRFDMADLRSGAEEMILSKYGGAIGVFSASRVVNSADNAALNDLFYKTIFTRDQDSKQYPTLGQALYLVKQIRTNSNDEKFFLLGDPTLRLLIPYYEIRIDSINGVYVGDGIDTSYLKALSKVNITAYIINPITKEIEKSFNGKAILTMLDCDLNIVAIDTDIDKTAHRFTKPGPALNRSLYQVSAGEFKASFIIPKDISFINKPGRILAYAFSEDKRYAKGSSQQFKINGIDPTASDDNQGPKISIYLDSKDFKVGDIVSSSPLLIVDLWDKSGINTTGIGIGHRIEAWLDDATNSIDLTDYFNTSLEDSRSGTAQKILFNLNKGYHKIRVRAWDVFDNYSVEETYFYVIDGIYTSEVLCYPNPFSNFTTFRFKHNISPPFNYELGILNSLGQTIFNRNGDITSNNIGEINWDGKNNEGFALSQGAYYFYIKILTNKGELQTKFGQFQIIK